MLGTVLLPPSKNFNLKVFGCSRNSSRSAARAAELMVSCFYTNNHLDFFLHLDIAQRQRLYNQLNVRSDGKEGGGGAGKCIPLSHASSPVLNVVHYPFQSLV